MENNQQQIQAVLEQCRVNPEHAKLFANGKCKYCNGLGQIMRSWPGYTETRTDVCGCVIKNVKKFIREIQTQVV